MRTIVWFRDEDLRLADHAPLSEAAQAGEVLPLFVLEPRLFGPEAARQQPHRTQVLLDALHGLARSLTERGSRLLVVEGASTEAVPKVAREWKADRVAAQAAVDPDARARDAKIERVLGARFVLHPGLTLLPAGSLRTQDGHAHRLYATFVRAFWHQARVAKPLPAPRVLPPVPRTLGASPLPGLEALGLDRNPSLPEGGERPAQDRLRGFVEGALLAYARDRDRMDLPGTSRLSSYLSTGTLSIRTVWSAVREAHPRSAAARAFLYELLWREFAYDVLWNHPSVVDAPFQPRFEDFPWQEDAARWEAWVLGRTGYPVVDASARQLLSEGFVHNRARMISASFLTKHLLLDYRRGEAHFRRFLCDWDAANNNYGWQWSVGCGCDAQPYFRVFNPVLQGEKFDPTGEYVRRWVPELTGLPAEYIHRPWEAPAAVLSEAKVRLGTDYPRPVVDHRFARARYLELAGAHLKVREDAAASAPADAP